MVAVEQLEAKAGKGNRGTGLGVALNNLEMCR